MEIYEIIKQRRLELKMSQQELADLTGYTDRSSIAKIERGLVDLTQSKIEAFAKALHTTPSYLMGWTEVNEAAESTNAVDIMKDALVRTGYYETEFTDDEIIDIMKYAQFVLTKRTD